MNDKAEQLALVYVTLDDAIVDVLFVLQPEGGFFPLVLMQPWGIFKFKFDLIKLIINLIDSISNSYKDSNEKDNQSGLHE